MEHHLIFEGVDRVGKTTLIAALNNYKRFKMTAPITPSETYLNYLSFFLKINGWTKNVGPRCFDRGHISELVYGSLYRPKNYEDGVLNHWIAFMELEAIISSRRYGTRATTIVYIEPCAKHLMLEDERPNSNRSLELETYEYMLKRSKFPIIRLKTQTENAWKSVDQIILELKEKLNDC